MDIISQSEAKILGQKHFFTGIPCQNGHNDKRFTSDRSCVVCRREKARKWIKDNKDVKAAYDAKYNKINRKSRSEYMKKWARANREKLRSHDNNMKKKRRGAKGKISQSDIEKIKSAQANKCANCLKSIKKSYHIDHIQPIARGGENKSENIQILCPSCNLRKKDKCPYDWALQNGRLL